MIKIEEIRWENFPEFNESFAIILIYSDIIRMPPKIQGIYSVFIPLHTKIFTHGVHGQIVNISIVFNTTIISTSSWEKNERLKLPRNPPFAIFPQLEIRPRAVPFRGGGTADYSVARQRGEGKGLQLLIQNQSCTIWDRIGVPETCSSWVSFFQGISLCTVWIVDTAPG